MTPERVWTEEERREALRKYQIVGSPPEEAFEEIVRFAADTCRTPIALISFVEELRQWFKAVVGLPQRETPRAAAICASAMLADDVFVVSDLSADARFAANPLVVSGPKLRFYAGVPLKTPDGVPLGTLSVLDVKPRRGGLDPDQRRALTRLAAQVMVELELRRDALERREELCRVQQHFDQAPVLLSVVSPAERKFEYVNRVFRSLVPDRAIVGQTLHEAFPAALAGEFITSLMRTCETGVATTGKDANFLTAVGRRCITFSHQPVTDDGQIFAVISVGIDVTEEHAAREEANRLRSELDLARQGSTVDVVSAMIAHELNQPLAAARNYIATAEVLLKRQADELNTEKMIAAAGAQLDRAGSIIRRIRGLAAGERLPVEPVSLRSCVDNVRDLIQVSGEPSRLRIVTDYQGRDSILASRVQIEQALLNLFRNGAQAMMTAHGDPLLSVHTRDLNDEFVEVEIRDGGPGIPDDLMEHVFDPFHRSTTGGMGLGLAIVRSIVESHGGRITVTNENGAVFRLALRAAETTLAGSRAIDEPTGSRSSPVRFH